FVGQRVQDSRPKPLRLAVMFAGSVKIAARFVGNGGPDDFAVQFFKSLAHVGLCKASLFRNSLDSAPLIIGVFEGPYHDVSAIQVRICALAHNAFFPLNYETAHRRGQVVCTALELPTVYDS